MPDDRFVWLLHSEEFGRKEKEGQTGWDIVTEHDQQVSWNFGGEQMWG